MTETFYLLGKVYERPDTGWKFRADCYTSYPDDGELTALGWRYWDGKWEPYAYTAGDWEIQNMWERLSG